MRVHIAIHRAVHIAVHRAVHRAVHIAVHIAVHRAVHIAVHRAVHIAVHIAVHREVYIAVPLLLSGITNLSKIINNNNNNTVHVECKSKNGTGNNIGSCDNLRFVQTIPDKHTWRARHQRKYRKQPYCALHCTALHCTALHRTALHCTALHCTALHSCFGKYWCKSTKHLSL